MRIVAVLLLVGSVAHAKPARNDPWNNGRNWSLGIEGQTDFPLQVGMQLWVELPHRFRLSTSFGEMPTLYLDAINAVAVSAGAYNNAAAALLSESLDHAFTWRLHVGWRPFKRRGAYFELGYGLLDVHGNIAIVDVIQAATGLMAPVETNLRFEFRMDTLVQTIGIEVGWMWFLWRDLTLRFALGFAAAVDANVHIHPNFLSTQQGVFSRLAGDFVEQLIEKHLIIPTVGLAIGWRLF